MIGNLVANAMVYGATDRPVTVTSAVTAEGFILSVHNEGLPVQPGQVPDLFRAMTRGVGAGTSARSVGLGLFIVREIARAHGGDVSVVSNAEEGTTFTTTCLQ